MWRFGIEEDQGGHPTWRLYDGDTLIAWAGESFASKSNAKRSATSFKNGAAAAKYEVYEDAGGKWRWRAWRSSDKVAVPRTSFDSEAAAKASADTVRDNAGGAALE